ncbi:MAG TPA: hypothetical protein DDW52_28070 [Planctomycetaceae bacterium]|nr:hypothetical protein [Planctomycetaceae bacterium]
MDTQKLAPGVYVRDIKPSLRSYESASISNGVMFAQSTVDASGTAQPVKIRSVADFGQHFGGTAMLAPVLLKQCLEWSNDGPAISQNALKDIRSEALKFLKTCQKKIEDQQLDAAFKLLAPEVKAIARKTPPAIDEAAVDEIAEELGPSFGISDVSGLDDLVGKLKEKVASEKPDWSQPMGDAAQRCLDVRDLSLKLSEPLRVADVIVDKKFKDSSLQAKYHHVVKEVTEANAGGGILAAIEEAGSKLSRSDEAAEIEGLKEELNLGSAEPTPAWDEIARVKNLEGLFKEPDKSLTSKPQRDLLRNILRLSSLRKEFEQSKVRHVVAQDETWIGSAETENLYTSLKNSRWLSQRDTSISAFMESELSDAKSKAEFLFGFNAYYDLSKLDEATNLQELVADDSPAIDSNDDDPSILSALGSVAATMWSVYGFFLNGGKVLTIYNIKHKEVENALNDQVLSSLTQPDIDVGLLMAPGQTSPLVASKLKAFAGRRDGIDAAGESFAFAVLDRGLSEESQKPTRSDGFDGHSTACFWPWLVVGKSKDGTEIRVPPSAFMAGAIAGTDGMYGAHYAAAGEEKVVKGAIGLTHYMTDTENGELNAEGINCLRRFPGGDPLIWGARTLSSDPNYRYIPVARLLLQIRKTIKQQTRWAVFKPNTDRLRKSIVRNLHGYLEGLRRNEALEGSSPAEAFQIICDETNNTDDDRRLGRLNVRVAVAPVRPAEFIIVDVTQFIQAAS